MTVIQARPCKCGAFPQMRSWGGAGGTLLVYGCPFGCHTAPPAQTPEIALENWNAESQFITSDEVAVAARKFKRFNQD